MTTSALAATASLEKGCVLEGQSVRIRNLPLCISNYDINDDPLAKSLRNIEVFLAGTRIIKLEEYNFDNDCQNLKEGLKSWHCLDGERSRLLRNIVELVVTRKKNQVCTNSQQRLDIYTKILSNFTDNHFIATVIAHITMFVTPARVYSEPDSRLSARIIIKVAFKFFRILSEENQASLKNLKSLVIKSPEKFTKEEKFDYSCLAALFNDLNPVEIESTPRKDSKEKSVDEDFVELGEEYLREQQLIKTNQHAKMCDVFARLFEKFGKISYPEMWYVDQKTKAFSPEFKEVYDEFVNVSEVYCFRSPQEVASFQIILVREIAKSLERFFGDIMKEDFLFNPSGYVVDDPKNKSKKINVESVDDQTKKFIEKYREVNSIASIKVELTNLIRQLINLLRGHNEADIFTKALSQIIVKCIEQYVGPELIGYIFIRFKQEQPKEKGKQMFDTLEGNKPNPPILTDHRYSKYLSDIIKKFVQTIIEFGIPNYAMRTAKDSDTVLDNIEAKVLKIIQEVLVKINSSTAMMMPYLILEHLVLKTSKEGNKMPLEDYFKLNETGRVNIKAYHKEFILNELVQQIEGELGTIKSTLAGALIKNICTRIWQVTQSKECLMKMSCYMITGLINAIESKKNGNIVIA